MGAAQLTVSHISEKVKCDAEGTDNSGSCWFFKCSVLEDTKYSFPNYLGKK